MLSEKRFIYNRAPNVHNVHSNFHMNMSKKIQYFCHWHILLILKLQQNLSSQYSSLLLYDYHYFLMTLAFSVYSQYLYPQIIQLNQCLNFHLIDTYTKSDVQSSRREYCNNVWRDLITIRTRMFKVDWLVI